jgi:hypothetical protein
MEDPWENYNICECCGAEESYDDIEIYRERWINEGCKWFDLKSFDDGRPHFQEYQVAELIKWARNSK